MSRRETKPYTAQPNGMVERFNGCIASEILRINVVGHTDFGTLLTSFNHAYNRRRQRGLLGQSPIGKEERRLTFKRDLVNPLTNLLKSNRLSKVK